MLLSAEAHERLTGEAWSAVRARAAIAAIVADAEGAFDEGRPTHPRDVDGPDSFSQAKGQGNGMHNQPTITCTTPPETATAGELAIPGLNPTDVIEFDFTVEVVVKP